jgi:hypothetical protein
MVRMEEFLAFPYGSFFGMVAPLYPEELNRLAPRDMSYPDSKKQNRSLYMCAQDVQITHMSTI